MFYIYKRMTPDGKVYIGCTTRSLEARAGTRGLEYSRNQHFWSAIQKFGWSSINSEILATADNSEEAKRLEDYWIQYYDATNPLKGYNQDRVSRGCPTIPSHTAAEKQKIGKSSEGRIWIQNGVEQRRVYSYELEQLLSQGWSKGRLPVSDKARCRLSKSKQGRIRIIKNGVIRVIPPKDLESFLAAGWIKFKPESVKRTTEEIRYSMGASARGKKWVRKDGKAKRVNPEEVSAYLDKGWELGGPLTKNR